MKHTSVRTDDFETQGTLLRVTGRQGYEKSTDVWITKTAELEFEQKGEDTNDPGWNVLNGEQEHYRIPYELEHLNLNGKVDLQLAKHPVCNSLDNVKIKPVGCTSFYNAYPKTQSKLLPYLIPSGTRDRVEFQRQTTALFDSSSESGVVPPVVYWNPLVNDHFVFTTHPDSHLVGDIHDLATVGFCPRSKVFGGQLHPLIQFGVAPGDDGNNFAAFVGASPHLIRVDYSEYNDELSFNSEGDVVVLIDAHVLNQAVNPGGTWHHFKLDMAVPVRPSYIENDKWTMKFDKNGIAGRVSQHSKSLPHEVQQAEQVFGLKNGNDYDEEGSNNAKYVYSETRFNEFWELFLSSPHETRKILPNNTTPIPVAHVGSTLRLFLRRPKFSKGQLRNWETDPGINRLFTWFDKRIDDNGPVEHRLEGFNTLPTPFNIFGHQRSATVDKAVGEWGVTWADTGNIDGNGDYPERMINSFVLTIDDWDLFERLRTLANIETICLKLQGGQYVVKSSNGFANDRPPVLIAEVPFAQNRYDYLNRQFFIQFQRQHAVFTVAPNIFTITITRLGGALPLWHVGNAAFANGKPLIGSVDDLFGNAANNDAGAWLASSVPGQSLVGVPTALATDYTSDVTEIPFVFAQNTRPMFHTDVLQNENFSHHVKALPTEPGVGQPGEPLFDALAVMFQGDVYCEEPKFSTRLAAGEPRTTYREVLMGRNKANKSVEFHEPFFGLDSGMSTYGVNKIFKPKPWHSILLQDVDYFFQHPNKSDATFQRGSDKYTMVIDEEIQSFTGKALLTHSDTTKLTVRSRDGLDQRVKLLEHVHDSYPLFEKSKIQVTGSVVPSGTVSIYSERGVPDFLFIYAERNLRDDATFIPSGNPIIAGISFYGRANALKTLGFPYLISKHELWQATLRNAHYQSKAEDLYEIGGCLLSREDLGTMERQNFRLSDPFDYDMKVTLENETGGSHEEQLERNLDDITLHVCCIYEDSVILKGTAQTLTFLEEKRN